MPHVPTGVADPCAEPADLQDVIAKGYEFHQVARVEEDPHGVPSYPQPSHGKDRGGNAAARPGIQCCQNSLTQPAFQPEEGHGVGTGTPRVLVVGHPECQEGAGHCKMEARAHLPPAASRGILTKTHQGEGAPNERQDERPAPSERQDERQAGRDAGAGGPTDDRHEVLQEPPNCAPLRRAVRLLIGTRNDLGAPKSLTKTHQVEAARDGRQSERPAGREAGPNGPTDDWH